LSMFRCSRLVPLALAITTGALLKAGEPEPLELQQDKGTRPIAVKVKNDTPAIGFILPGSRVDVMVTKVKDKGEKVVEVLLKDVQVLAVDCELLRGEGENSKPETLTFTLAVK